MVSQYESGTGTVAGIAGHPLHPMVVPLPIGALIGAFVADIVYLLSGDVFWAHAAYWLIAAGLLTGAVAAVLGIIDLVGLRRARTMGLAWLHGSVNAVALAISLVSYLMRHANAEGVAGGAGVFMTGAVAALLALSGWLGGEMSYRHGVGVGRNIGHAGESLDHERTPSGRPDRGRG